MVFFKSQLIAYFIAAIIALAVLFPAFNILKRISSLLRIVLLIAMALYLIRISELISSFVKRHHSNLARLSERYKAKLKERAKKRE